MRAFLAVCLAIGSMQPAIAGQTNGSTQTAQEEKSEDSSASKVICKRENSTGSRLRSTRVCRTAAEWEQIRQAQRQEVEKAQTARWKSD